MTKADIFYKDIGDYLSREEKLKIVSERKSILNPELGMTQLKPNAHGDWINERNSKFDEFIPIEPDKKFDTKTKSFFSTYAIGVSTNRDAWVYNFSNNMLKSNMKKMISFYNEQRKMVEIESKRKINTSIEDYIDTNPQKISWTRSLRNDVIKNISHKFKENEITMSVYRPYIKAHLYYDKPFIESPGLWSQLFVKNKSENRVICLTGIGTTKDFTLLIVEQIPCLDVVEKGQCFPLYWYEKKEKVQGGLFEQTEDDYICRDAISDFILEQAKTRYGNKVIKEDIFYYVYGILHSEEYRRTFANDLKKMLPRLPLVEKPADFWAFSKAGRELAELHLNYEQQPAPKDVLINGQPALGGMDAAESDALAGVFSKKKLQVKNPQGCGFFTVNQMKFPAKNQKDTILYNSYLTISNIPAKAYEYVVNGKSAIEWIMERYAVTTHKESGIKNDPNDWAKEHDNPQYILDLLLSVITVSVKTVDIVAGLPKVDWK